MPTVGQWLAGREDRAQPRYAIAVVKTVTPAVITLPGGAETGALIPVGLTLAAGNKVFAILSPAANVIVARLP